MAEGDKSVFGRKVFFIMPEISLESQLLDRLRLMEYEVYVIDDYHKAKPILRKNPDSICYVCINDKLTLQGWHKFMKSFEDESVFSPLDMGIISPHISEDKRESFLSELQYDAGFIFQNQIGDNLLHEVIRNLDRLAAKGIRKYVRANCLSEPQADLLWIKDNRMFKLKIIDISSVGIAAKLSNSQANSVYINQIVEACTLNIRTDQILVDIKITAIKTAGDFLLVVIMFNSTTPADSINKIRRYIAANLQESIDSSIKPADYDKSDYDEL